MGIHFLWGPRESFEYTFEQQLDVRVPELPRPNGYYCWDDFNSMCQQSALMSAKKSFCTQPNGGGPIIPPWHAFHLDNPKLVKALEVFAREMALKFKMPKCKAPSAGRKALPPSCWKMANA